MEQFTDLSFCQFKIQVERHFLTIILEKNNWNKTKTAKVLDIQRSHLYNLIEKYNILPNEKPLDYFLDKIFYINPPLLPRFDYTHEIWAAYPFNPFYYVSNFGRIKTVDGTLLNITCNSYSYPSVSLFLNGKFTSKYTYRMVAETFLPNPENKPAVNHKNRIKTDCRLENLEWVTNSENVIHSMVTEKG